MDKNWTGDTNSVFKTLGASDHAAGEREMNDYYATDPAAGRMLLELERFQAWILEPACGEGHLSKVFIEAGHDVISTDLIWRGFGGQRNFFEYDAWGGDIITNPPYKYAQEFVEHALGIVQPKAKVAMFLKLQFLEGQKRRKLWETQPPKTVYVSSKRLLCAKNGEFRGQGSAVAYAWFVWEKGYEGDTTIKWFN